MQQRCIRIVSEKLFVRRIVCFGFVAGNIAYGFIDTQKNISFGNDGGVISLDRISLGQKMTGIGNNNLVNGKMSFFQQRTGLFSGKEG